MTWKRLRVIILFVALITTVFIPVSVHAAPPSQSRDCRAQTNALNDEGNALFFNANNYQAALDKWQTALEICREIGDRQREGVFLSKIGSAYNMLGQSHEALKYHEEALAIFREFGNREGEGHTLNGIGQVYWNLRQYQEALKYFKEELAIWRELGDREGEGLALRIIGNTYGILHQYQEALKYYEEALVIFKELGDQQTVGQISDAIKLVSAASSTSPFQGESRTSQIETLLNEVMGDGGLWLVGAVILTLGVGIGVLVLRKRNLLGATSSPREQEGRAERKRHGCLTAMLIVYGVFNSLNAILSISASNWGASRLPNAPGWAPTAIFVMGLIGAFAVISLIAIWYWKKWGAYLYGTTVIMNAFLNFILGARVEFLLGGLVGTALLIGFALRQWDDFE